MNYKTLKNHITRRIQIIACAIALTMGFMVSLTQSAHAQKITPPPMPTSIEVETGNEVFLVGHGKGTQNYVCSPCDPPKPNCPLGVAFKLFTPQATLFNHQEEQLTTHSFSPNQNTNPLENGIIRATRQDSRDTSTVWARQWISDIRRLCVTRPITSSCKTQTAP